MKTIKQAVMLTVASFAASYSFAQIQLGVANSTQAAISKSINVTGATRAASSAASRTVQSTRQTTGTLQHQVSEVKATATPVVAGSVEQTTQATQEVSQTVNESIQTKVAVSGSQQTTANASEAGNGASLKGETRSNTTADAKVSANPEPVMVNAHETLSSSRKTADERTTVALSKAAEVRSDAKAGAAKAVNKVSESKVQARTEAHSDVKTSVTGSQQ